MNILFLVTLLFSVVSAANKTVVSVPYGTLCLNMLGNAYKFKNSNCTTSYRKAKCYCKDPQFQVSLVSCINKYVANVTASKRNSTKQSAYKVVSSTCSSLNSTVLTKLEKNITNLPVYYGGNSGKKPGQWPVNGSFALTNKELSDAVKAYTKPLNSKIINRNYGSAMIGYWAGILVIKGFTFWVNKMFPSMQHKIGNTSVGRFYRRYFQVFCSRFTLNTMMQMLAIFGFIVLAACLTFCNIPVYNPNYNYRYSSVAAYSNALGVRTGFLFLYIMPLFFLFAGRNNFLQHLVGWTQEPFLVFHRWIARVSIGLLVAHAIAYTLARTPLGAYKNSWNSAYWNWGVVGLAFGVFIFFQAFKLFRRRFYETFVFLHIVAACLFLVGGYYHLKLLKDPKLMYYFYATFAVWGFDRTMRIFRILFAGVHKANIKLVDSHMLLLTINKPRFWPNNIVPGTYVFVHFFIPFMTWQSHPLTMTTCSEDPTKIRLYFRVYNGISKKIAQRVTEKEGKDFYVLLDGPYGMSHPLKHFEEVVFIAGGSGVTAPLAYIQSAIKREPNKKFRKVSLYWTISNQAALEWFSTELKFLREQAEANVYLFINSKDVSRGTVNILQGEESDENKVNENVDEKQVANSQTGSISVQYGERLNVPGVIESAITNSTGSLGIMCCGPTSLHVSTRDAIFKNMDKTSNYVQYYEEAYSW